MSLVKAFRDLLPRNCQYPSYLLSIRVVFLDGSSGESSVLLSNASVGFKYIEPHRSPRRDGVKTSNIHTLARDEASLEDMYINLEYLCSYFDLTIPLVLDNQQPITPQSNPSNNATTTRRPQPHRRTRRLHSNQNRPQHNLPRHLSHRPKPLREKHPDNRSKQRNRPRDSNQLRSSRSLSHNPRSPLIA